MLKRRQELLLCKPKSWHFRESPQNAPSHASSLAPSIETPRQHHEEACRFPPIRFAHWRISNKHCGNVEPKESSGGRMRQHKHSTHPFKLDTLHPRQASEHRRRLNRIVRLKPQVVLNAPTKLTICTGSEEGMKKIKVIPPPRSTTKICPDPIKQVTNDQIQLLDPTGARTRLFAPTNPDRVQPGDILLVRLKSGEPFSGVCLNIRQRHQPIDTAILLRNQLTRIGVEMWFKVYSPNVEGIEVVQRKEKRARRAKLYYMRQPRHDVGSVEGIVRQYVRQRMGGPTGSDRTKGRDANSHRKKNNRKGRN